ncbi:MAG: glycogen synthase GlgA [Candidatus Limnocylindrales bacterium]
MRIAFAAAEVAPYVKVGGLADVAGSLPQALAVLGHEVTVYLPRHRSVDLAAAGAGAARGRAVLFAGAPVGAGYRETWRAGVKVIFVENDELLGRDVVYGAVDDADRYAFFCAAVAADLADQPPDIVHAHDWHTGLLMPLVAAAGRSATVFTIHNLAYQGQTGAEVLHRLGLPRTPLAVEAPGECNPMARAIVAAGIVSTVSERYAVEIRTAELGEGLDGLLRDRGDPVRGIVNGIDTALFDPAADPHIAAGYSADDPRGKAVCKEALQRELAFATDPAIPLIGVVGRLVEQKGVDLLTAVAPDLLEGGAQLVVLGSGDPAYEEHWRRLAHRYAHHLALTLGFEAALAQRIYAGADLFLMPSRFEPCGLGQLIALRYGTIPVARAVGGLADTVHDLEADPKRANGFTFAGYDRVAFSGALARALREFGRGDRWTLLRDRGMREDHSWSVSAARYVELYREAIARQ